jgi:hypothetical protein
VSVRIGISDAVGVVVEDRGLIGVNGRRLLRVEVAMGSGVAPIAVEVPAEEALFVASGGRHGASRTR